MCKTLNDLRLEIHHLTSHTDINDVTIHRDDSVTTIIRHTPDREDPSYTVSTFVAYPPQMIVQTKTQFFTRNGYPVNGGTVRTTYYTTADMSRLLPEVPA